MSVGNFVKILKLVNTWSA